MNKIIYPFASAIFGMGFIACSDDHKPDWNETSPIDVSVSSVSIEDGAVVGVDVDSLEVIYNQKVVINTNTEISLEGGTLDSVAVRNGNRLVAYFRLKAASSYKYVVPSNGVAGIGTKTFAPGVEISFSTPKNGNVIDASKLDANLMNANATAEAKAVYSLLTDNYGKRQLSGAMGEVAWGTSFCDYIYNASGKYPAIVGFDYIHLASSPSNWIDYGDITPVKSVWEAGSIPAVTWHWNVPVSKDSDDIKYDASSEEFKAANVLVEGTWENEVATADVDKLAGYLTLLQNAGIPVLWRPFHEAAGDYTWGSWFWWGNSGTDTTIQLWKWLRDKLTIEYGLNNLIWVWTVQTEDEGKNADMAKVRAAYPGNDVVDIVGTDIYGDALGNFTDKFSILYNLTEGKKIVALSECGNLADVDSAYADGALWCFFMGWYEQNESGPLFGAWNTKNEWKTVQENPLVLNRGDFKF